MKAWKPMNNNKESKIMKEKINIRKYFLMIKLKVVLIIYMINGTAFSLNWFKSNS